MSINNGSFPETELKKLFETVKNVCIQLGIKPTVPVLILLKDKIPAHEWKGKEGKGKRGACIRNSIKNLALIWQIKQQNKQYENSLSFAYVPFSMGLYGIDIDIPSDKKKAPIEVKNTIVKKTLERLQIILGSPVGTMRTPSGGCHALYIPDPNVPLQQNKHLNISGIRCDIRHSNGYLKLYDFNKLIEILEKLPNDRITFEQIQLLVNRYSTLPTTKKKDWGVGNRNNTLFSAACTAMRKQDKDELALLRKEAAKAGLKYGEIQKTITSAQDTVRFERSKHTFASKTYAFSSAGLSECLVNLHIHVRYNERSKTVEYFSPDNPALQKKHVWTSADDIIEASIRDQIACSFKYKGANNQEISVDYSQKRYDEKVNACLIGDKRVDPFKIWIDNLKKWDGVYRLEKCLIKMFDCKDTELHRFALKSLLVGAIRRAYHPGCRHDHVVILVGKKNTGKTTFFEFLFPREFREQWLGNDLYLSDDNKRMVESILSFVIIDIPEMQGVRKADWERIKAFITRKHDNGVRLAYRKNAEKDMGRRCVFAGTSNNITFLQDDPTGSHRRFLPVQVNTGCNVAEHMTNEFVLQLWAEAKHFYLQGMDSNIPFRLLDSLYNSAQQFTHTDELIMAVMEVLDNGHINPQEKFLLKDVIHEFHTYDSNVPNKKRRGSNFTMYELWLEKYPQKTIEYKMSDCLKKLGFKRVKKKYFVYWIHTDYKKRDFEIFDDKIQF